MAREAVQTIAAAVVVLGGLYKLGTLWLAPPRLEIRDVELVSGAVRREEGAIPPQNEVALDFRIRVHNGGRRIAREVYVTPVSTRDDNLGTWGWRDAKQYPSIAPQQSTPLRFEVRRPLAGQPNAKAFSFRVWATAATGPAAGVLVVIRVQGRKAFMETWNERRASRFRTLRRRAHAFFAARGKSHVPTDDSLFYAFRWRREAIKHARQGK